MDGIVATNKATKAAATKKIEPPPTIKNDGSWFLLTRVDAKPSGVHRLKPPVEDPKAPRESKCGIFGRFIDIPEGMSIVPCDRCRFKA